MSSFSVPHDNVLQMGLSDGMTVGDFGAGSGHYARAAAGVVGDGGRVYAIDIQEHVLTHAHRNSNQHHQRIIKTLWGDIERPGGTSLRGHTLDAVILANILFQIERRDGLIAEIKRTLKPGGKLLVVDWAGSYGGLGPPHDHVITEHVAEELFIGEGFHKVKSFRAGPHHYGILFTSPQA